MDETLRKPQTLGGEIFPRNFFIGNEVCRQFGSIIAAFKKEGINLHAIPLINEIEQSFIENKMREGTVIGFRTPINEFDSNGVIVWDGLGIVAMSLMTFHKKVRSNWTLGQERFQKENPKRIEKKKKKKSKKTTPRHQIKKQRKARNGRRV